MKDNIRKKWVITFSRRSDPAFFMDWFRERVREGGCSVPNPFSGKPYAVSLRPEDVHILSFWTKTPGALLPCLKEFRERGFSLVFLISLTGYPRWLERHVPEPERLREDIQRLSEEIGQEALWWRYDPVILTKSLDLSWHRENFHRLCETVWSGRTSRAILSLAHIDGPYAGIRKSLTACCRADGDELRMPSTGQPGYEEMYRNFVDLTADFTVQAGRAGIGDCGVCCSPGIREEDRARVRQTRCLDLDHLRRIVPDLPDLPIRGTRRGSEPSGYAPCGCVESRDIGINGTCGHGCLYCYANRFKVSPPDTG